MPRVFTESRPYRLFIIFSLANALRHCALRHDSPSVALHHQLRLHPQSRFRHRRALIAALVVASVAPPSGPPACHRHAASIAPWLRPLSRLRCTLRRALHHASVPPLRHGPPQPPLGDKRCTAAPCHYSGEYLAPPSAFPATVAPPILPGVNSKCVISFPFCIFFYDLGNCFAFWWGFWLIFALFFCYFYGLLFILLSLIALEDLSIVGVHHLPLSFNFHAPRFLILLFSKILLSIMY